MRTHGHYSSCMSTFPSPLGCEQRCSFQGSYISFSSKPAHTSARRIRNVKSTQQRERKKVSGVNGAGGINTQRMTAGAAHVHHNGLGCA